jgi:hypothetical protein
MFNILYKIYSSLYTFIDISTLVFFPEETHEEEKFVVIDENGAETEHVIEDDLMHEYIRDTVNDKITKIIGEDFLEVENRIMIGLEDFADQLETFNKRLSSIEKKVKYLNDVIKINEFNDKDNKDNNDNEYTNIQSYQDLTHPLNWQDEYITTDYYRDTGIMDVTISDNIKKEDYENIMKIHVSSFENLIESNGEDENNNKDESDEIPTESPLITEKDATECESEAGDDFDPELENEIEVY